MPKRHFATKIRLILMVLLGLNFSFFLSEYIAYGLKGMHLADMKQINKIRPVANAQSQAPWEVHGDLRVIGHHLEYEDGVKFFWYGDMAWSLFTRLDLTEAEDYLSERASQGMTVIQANALGLLGHGLTADTCVGVNEELDRDPYDIQPFASTYDATSAKVAEYWSHVESIIDIAADHGLYIALLPAWGTIAIEGWGDDTDPNKIFSDSSDAYDYGQWIGDRFKDKKNIIWVIGGDVAGDYCNAQVSSNCVCGGIYSEHCQCSDVNNCPSLDMWNSLASGIKAGDTGDHLMTGHFQTVDGRELTKPSDWFASESWLDFDTIYTKYFVRELNEAYDDTPTRPNFVSEGTFLGYGYDDFRYRRMCYQAFLAGGKGYTMGESNIWMFYDENKIPQGIDPDPLWNDVTWQDRLNRTEMDWNTNCSSYFKSIEWWKLVPAQQLIVTGEISDDYERRRAAAYSSDNDLILVYFPDNSVNATINIANFDATNAQVKWMNPFNSIEKLVGFYPTDQNLEVHPPSTWDDGSDFRDGLLIITTGPIAHWKLDETSGTIASDSSDNNFDATLLHGPTWTTGKSNNALSFDGSNDYVEDSDAENYINDLDAISISLWVKSDIINTDNGFVRCYLGDSTDSHVNMRYDSSGYYGGGTNAIKLGLETTAGAMEYESASDVQTTDWQHLVMIWKSGESIKLYINKVVDTPSYDSGPVSGTISKQNTLRFGEGVKTNWDGLIDDVRIYDRVLSASEIEDLHNAFQ